MDDGGDDSLPKLSRPRKRQQEDGIRYSSLFVEAMKKRHQKEVDQLIESYEDRELKMKKELSKSYEDMLENAKYLTELVIRLNGDKTRLEKFHKHELKLKKCENEMLKRTTNHATSSAARLREMTNMLMTHLEEKKLITSTQLEYLKVNCEPKVLVEDDLMRCPICFQAMSNGHTISVTVCKHAFHKVCLDEYFRVTEKNHCPMCRTVSKKNTEINPFYPMDGRVKTLIDGGMLGEEYTKPTPSTSFMS